MRQRLGVILLVGTAAAHADAILEYDGNDAACHAEFSRVAIRDLSLRVDSAPPQQDQSFVYDAGEKVGVALDHRRRQFFEMEFDDDAIDFQGDVMHSSSAMVNRKMQETQVPPFGGQAGANGMPQVDPKMLEAMMQQNMQHLPPEQRAKMQEAMQNFRSATTVPPEPVVEVTDERREVNGIACTVERVSEGGTAVREDCRAPAGDLGLDAADVKRLQRSIARFQKFSASIRDNLHLPMMPTVQHRPVDTSNLLVERRCLATGGDVRLRLRQESAPADWFSTPADYARMDLGMGGR